MILSYSIDSSDKFISQVRSKVDDAKVETKKTLCEYIMPERPTVFENEKTVETDLTGHLAAKGIKRLKRKIEN